MDVKLLNFSEDDLYLISNKVLEIAKKNGATASDVEISVSSGKTISTRMGSLESIELNNGKSLSITVFFKQHQGISSTSDFSNDALESCVKAACQIAKYTAEDKAFGLADPILYSKDVKDLKIYNPYFDSQELMIQKVLECEDYALNFDSQITNSEGAQLSTSENLFVYQNSAGFSGGYPSSRSSLSCSVVAKSSAGMQRDYSYSSERSYTDLKLNKFIGQDAAQRAINRLNVRPIKTGKYPIIFEAPIATSIISSLSSAISGANLYRETSFLINSLNTKISPDFLSITENPFIKKGHASRNFDGEGVRIAERKIVDNGFLKSYFLSSYSARKLGMQSTGNSGGAHNLVVNSSEQTLEELVQGIDKGLLITELLGHGLNMVTGDYSRGAAGFWIESGKIQHAVEEITIASNLKDMLLNIKAVANDTYQNSSKYTGSIMIEPMTVAANS
ncbi:metalloprotease PmbA [Methylophilaceae bacterium]|nr:metalloprotease PmbA [Methylophilaceae bacterium]|tara:strand:- start:84 stop:1427 length:1344 start_codon:yes stop_codon:yes gene_type:complete